MNNRYRELHVFSHYVVKPNGDYEDVIEDRQEKWQLTEEGRAMEEKIRALLERRLPSISLFFLTGGVGSVLASIVGTAFAFNVARGWSWEKDPAGVYALFVGGLGTYFVCLALVSVTWSLVHYRKKCRVCPHVAQFAVENPEFMEALAGVSKLTTETCDRLIRLHRKQHKGA